MTNFRIAGAEDIPAIRKIAEIAFPATYSSIITGEQIGFMMAWMYSEDSIRNDIEGDVTFILLNVDGKDIGYVSFGPEGEHYHLHKIYLLPDFQGKGFGRLLFTAAEDEMRSRGVKMFELNVNRHNKAVDFYIRMGMHIDRSGDFDIGSGFYMNDYIMQKDL